MRRYSKESAAHPSLISSLRWLGREYDVVAQVVCLSPPHAEAARVGGSRGLASESVLLALPLESSTESEPRRLEALLLCFACVPDNCKSLGNREVV